MTVIDKHVPMGVRLGLAMHVSPLRIRLEAVSRRFPASGAECLEDWLLDVANARGARIVVRHPPPGAAFIPPPSSELSDEELVVAICQLQGADRPQLLRVAAQLISRGTLDMVALRRLAIRERGGSILGALAREALKVAPDHACWRMVADACASAPRPHDTVLHWSRLAEPVMKDKRCNAVSWRLVA